MIADGILPLFQMRLAFSLYSLTWRKMTYQLQGQDSIGGNYQYTTILIDKWDENVPCPDGT